MMAKARGPGPRKTPTVRNVLGPPWGNRFPPPAKCPGSSTELAPVSTSVLDRGGFAGSSPPVRISGPTGLQRSDPGGKVKWIAYCESNNGKKHDPNCYDEVFLQRFFECLESNAITTDVIGKVATPPPRQGS